MMADNDSTYVAAAVQREVFPRKASDTPWQVLLRNALQFEKYISIAASASPRANIVVFPEWSHGGDIKNKETIFPYAEPLPWVTQGSTINPCRKNDTATPMLNMVSCMAARYKMLVCYNGVDKVPNTHPSCNSKDFGGQCVFNTQICLDEGGNLVAKYHKSHVAEVFTFDTPQQPEIVYFDSSFGVRFGVFICFDIMWPEPSNSLIEKQAYNIPYSVAINFAGAGPLAFKAWSWARKANIIVSNSGTDPNNGGFWSLGGANLTYNVTTVDEPGSKAGALLFGRLPKNPR